MTIITDTQDCNKSVTVCNKSVTIELQGHVFKVSHSGGPATGGGKRGAIRGFSAASRKRLLEKLARLEVQPIDGHRHCATMITLTYPGHCSVEIDQATGAIDSDTDLPSPQQAKADLRAFLERIRRRWPDVSAIWRFQMDSSGNRPYHPHFHIIFFGLPYIDKLMVRQWWSEIIGRPSPITRIESIRSWRGVMSYAARYVSAATAAGVLDYLAYLHGSSVTGRVWGVFNRACLPFGKLIKLAFDSFPWFHDLKRSARRYFAGVNGYRDQGFVLFTDNPERWLELLLFLGGVDASSFSA
jgi:hypothetical protein